MKAKKILPRGRLLAVLFPALLLACENPLVQDILRVSAEATGIHIHAEILEGGVYIPAGDISYGLSPAFTPELTDYTALVPEKTERITVSAIPYKNGTVQYREENGPDGDSGTFDFTGNASRIYITVNREYMDPMVYIILIKRKQPAWLNGITVSSDASGAVPLSPGFDPDTLAYTAVVPSTAETVEVTGSVRTGVEVSFKQDNGDFDTPRVEPADTPPFSSGNLPFPKEAEETAVTIRVFLPPSPENPDPSPVEYTLRIQRPGKVAAVPGQENNFILGDSAAEYLYYKAGEVVAFTVVPPFGYTTGAVYYTPEGGDSEPIDETGGVYAFVMPRGNISLKGEWTPVPPAPNVLYVRGLRDGETVEQIQHEKQVNGNTDDGSSWANASLDLQDVMDTKWAAGREIWVSAGKVNPDWSTVTLGSGWAGALNSTQLADRRNHAFVLRGGVHIYGGFAGTETAKNQRNPTKYETILSGDLGTKLGNAFHVIIAVDITQTTILESLTVSAGAAAGSDITVQGKTITGIHGGGVYTAGCTRDLQFINVTISGNNAGNGGGMYNNGSGPTLDHVTISGNTAASQGGGIYNNTGSSPFLTGSIVSGNKASGGGGGVYNEGRTVSDRVSLVFENVTVNNNEAASGTGGIQSLYTDFTGTNVEIHGNSTLGSGTGGVWNSYSTFTGTGIVVSGNTSVSGTGGVENYNSSIFEGTGIVVSRNTSVSGTGGMKNQGGTMTLTNARITGNSTNAAPASENAGGICNFSSGTVTLTNVEISGNSSNAAGGIAGGMYMGAKLTLTNVTVSGNRAGTGGGWGIYYTKKETPVVIRNSIIWGNGTAEQNIKYVYTDSLSIGRFRFDNTLVERSDSDGGSGFVGGNKRYNDPPAESFSGSAAEIFAGPLPPESAPESAPEGAYYLMSDSIGIDKGNTGLYTAVSGPSKDFAGNDRPQGAIDLGAYEKQ